jgi:NADPH:quinone reductase-like Zn-dependent oxidoreductase
MRKRGNAVRVFRFDRFGLEHLTLDAADLPRPGPGEIVLDVKALSLNYRDLMVVNGWYNPKLELPAVPVSDGAGVVAAVGGGVERVAVGDRVVSHFISGWIDGPFKGEYVGTTLGTPRAGLAAEQVVLPAEAVLPLPAGYDFVQAATLPIAALTAWSALVTEGKVAARQTVLTLGTGGVSIFALQLAKAMGANVVITSSSDEKLARARTLGADGMVNYRSHPDWEKEVLKLTDQRGVDVTVETGGAGTLGRSLRATRAGGVVAMLGALTGLQGKIDVAPVLMKRLRIAGIMVDSRSAFENMNRFIEQHTLRPVIDRVYPFEELPAAFRLMEAGGHFGKIVIER